MVDHEYVRAPIEIGPPDVPTFTAAEIEDVVREVTCHFGPQSRALLAELLAPSLGHSISKIIEVLAE